MSARAAPKVLMLVSELEDYAIAFANGAAEHMPVVLALPARQFATLAHWFDPRIDLRLMDWPRHRSLRNLKLLRDLRRLVAEVRPEVIHLLSNNTLWLNLLAPLWRRIPLVVTVHDVTPHPGDHETARLPAWAPRLMARQARHILVHGESLRQAAVAEFAKPRARVHVIAHPALPRYVQLARQEGLKRHENSRFNVLLFGRLYAYKGLALMLQAEALIGRGCALRVTIAGRGDDPGEWRALMGNPARYDIRHRFIPDLEVAQLFLDADVVVLPYLEASQSGVLHLACSFGRPVIATDVGELGVTVRAQGIGLVVPAGDGAALARALERLAADKGLRAALGHRAQLWAEGENAPASVGRQMLALYRRILAEVAP